MAKLKKVLFGILGAFLLMAVPAYAQAPGAAASFQKAHPGQHIREIYNQLGLTDDQKKQLEANKQQHRAEMESARQEMKTYREALHQELMRLQLDTLKVNEIHNQIKSLQNRMEDDKLSSILAVRAILTPDQFLKFINLMHKYKQEHE